MSTARLLIAGSRSGVGKTTISLGLMAALTNKSYKVQPFKVGPDYVDPLFHSRICSKPSYNLDSYFLAKDGVSQLLTKKTEESDLAIIEGVMGLFDGRGREGLNSSAEIARTTNTPVILVIDGQKMAQSAAALAYGYKEYDPKLNLQGVILNNISSERHYNFLKKAIEAPPVNLKVVGYLPAVEELEVPEGPLGLVEIKKQGEFREFRENLLRVMEEYVELEELMKIAEKAPELKIKEKKTPAYKDKYNVKIGVARDQAFNFYYQYNLDLLEEMGAELIYFSPLKDSKVPDVDALYLGGGFPERHLRDLAANLSMIKDIRKKVKEGLPLYAEGGGLLYLSKGLIDHNDHFYPLTELLPLGMDMRDSLMEMGYREVESIKDNLLLKEGEKCRGHLFHYSVIVKEPLKVEKCFKVNDSELKGYSPYPNLLGSYLHIHWGSNPKAAQNLLNKAHLYNMYGSTAEKS